MTPTGCRSTLLHGRHYAPLKTDAQPHLSGRAAPDVIRGCYKFKSYQPLLHKGGSHFLSKSSTLISSGDILIDAIKAAAQLAVQGAPVDAGCLVQAALKGVKKMA